MSLSLKALFTAFCVLPLACGGPAARIQETANRSATPAATQAEREISGQYAVNGAAANGNEPYAGILTVSQQGDVYGFRWQLNKGTRIGTGIQTGTAVAVSSARTGAGKGCGVVLYQIAGDGSMDGKSIRWGEERWGTERLIRVKGNAFVGEYTLAGTTAYGDTYTGKLTIKKDGSGYDLEWSRDFQGTPDEVAVGFGIWSGKYAAAVFGGAQCGFSLYDIHSNGDLEGNWGTQRVVTFGTETAKRQ